MPSEKAQIRQLERETKCQRFEIRQLQKACGLLAKAVERQGRILYEAIEGKAPPDKQTLDSEIAELICVRPVEPQPNQSGS